MGRLTKFEQIVNGMKSVMDVPLTVKMRTGIYSDKNTAHALVSQLKDWGVAMTTVIYFLFLKHHIFLIVSKRHKMYYWLCIA